jgi:hypothetical protein
MKTEQRQRRIALEQLPQNETNVVPEFGQELQPFHGRSVLEEKAEAELQKLFLARLDVHSRIEEIKRNRALLRARKVDVESKIASLRSFHAKLVRREEELSRSLRG